MWDITIARWWMEYYMRKISCHAISMKDAGISGDLPGIDWSNSLLLMQRDKCPHNSNGKAFYAILDLCVCTDSDIFTQQHTLMYTLLLTNCTMYIRYENKAKLFPCSCNKNRKQSWPVAVGYLFNMCYTKSWSGQNCIPQNIDKTDAFAL